jgi:hypothetical protein
MLTDDDLTRELGETFRAATTHLSYQGRTRPPRHLTPALPAAALGAAAVAATIVAVNAGGGAQHPAGSAALRPETVPSTVASPVLVTRTLRLAGFTIRYQHAAGSPDPLYVELGFHHIPPGLREIASPDPHVRVWVGKEPKTGDNALYVKAATRFGGELFALVSPTWSQQQLIEVLHHPRPVPAVSAGSGGSGS